MERNAIFDQFLLSLRIEDIVNLLVDAKVVSPQILLQEETINPLGETSITYQIPTNFVAIEPKLTLYSSDPTLTRRTVHVDSENVDGVVVADSFMLPNISDSIESIPFSHKWLKEKFFKIKISNANSVHPIRVSINTWIILLSKDYFYAELLPILRARVNLLKDISLYSISDRIERT